MPLSQLVRAGVFFLMSCSAAMAQSAPEQTGPKNCDAFYPAQQEFGAASGETVLTVHIAKDGTFSNFSVLKSSGHDALDNDAIACAKASSRPQKSSGEPVEVDWQATVSSQGEHIYLFVPDVVFCDARLYPLTAVQRGEQGRVKVSFWIGADGSPTDRMVVRSSGYADLDQAALNCLAPLHLAVPTQDGKPVQIDREFGIVFGMSNWG